MKGQTNAWLKEIISGEKISITLTTNQSSQTDLMGAVITVSYAGNLAEYTWEGSAIQTVIPPMTDYTVSYSDVNGYSTPESFSGKAIDGRVSEVIGTYNTEVVTVNVSAEEGEVSGHEIQIISDGNVLYTQTTPSASYKIPYGTSYTIKASEVNGYTTPPEQSFTASQPTRNVDVTYGVALKGVFIQDIYGRLYTEDEWDGTRIANGIAVLADECEFIFYYELYNIEPYWGPAGIIAPIPCFATEEDAKTDYDGLSNTVALFEDGNVYPAVNRTYEKISRSGQRGYLPSVGEAQVFYNNITQIAALYIKVFGYDYDVFLGGWSSTQYDKDKAWAIWVTQEECSIFPYPKNEGAHSLTCVHLFPFIGYPKIISFTLYSYSKTIQCQAWDGTGHEQWERSAFNTTGKTGDDLHTFMGGWGTEWAAAEVLEDGKTYYFVEPL